MRYVRLLGDDAGLTIRCTDKLCSDPRKGVNKSVRCSSVMQFVFVRLSDRTRPRRGNGI